MKYFDEAYYRLCQHASFDSALEADEQACGADETYFRRLWAQKQTEYLSMLSLPADSEEGKALFRAQVEAYAAQLQEELPERILKNVADVRVLAMNRAAPAVKKQIEKYCESNRRAAQRIERAYEKYYQKACADFALDMVSQIGFHDCLISEIVTQLGDLFFAFPAAQTHSYITAMRCVKCQKIKEDGLVAGAVWLYEEIYKAGDQYELQVLVQLPDGRISDFIIRAQRFEFRGAIT